MHIAIKAGFAMDTYEYSVAVLRGDGEGDESAEVMRAISFGIHGDFR